MNQGDRRSKYRDGRGERVVLSQRMREEQF